MKRKPPEWKYTNPAVRCPNCGVPLRSSFTGRFRIWALGKGRGWKTRDLPKPDAAEPSETP